MVYVVAKRVKNNEGKFNQTILYVGETENLKERFDDHHKNDCFSENGANCIDLLIESDEKERLKIEKDIKAKWKPKCND